MGWCSGTEVFDPMVKAILEAKMPVKTQVFLIRELTDTLEDQDWDCHYDSSYADNPIVKSVWEELHPDWYEEYK